MPRVRYSPEVRTDILRRIHGGELSHAQAAREVGCSQNTIQQWLHPRRSNSSSCHSNSSSCHPSTSSCHSNSSSCYPSTSSCHPSPSPASPLVSSSSGTPTLRHPHDGQASFLPIRLSDTPIRLSDTPIRLPDTPIRLPDTRSATLELTTPSGIHLRLIGVTSDVVIEVLKTLS